MVGLTEARSPGETPTDQLCDFRGFRFQRDCHDSAQPKEREKDFGFGKERPFRKILDPLPKMPLSNKESKEPQGKHAKGKVDNEGDDSGNEAVSPTKKPVKGILKCRNATITDSSTDFITDGTKMTSF
ncbi:hypothetical protein Acr_15g0016160 [Actinidia rufa]|uniref:Uncharacterized protein n=1 Tax=Actinidia rufa TaxID=165716 RepID=A0A7J0FYJ9_9ERIC|nr:hypothetical protein Acr_15g0016160 [Actinidia rufa]